MMLSVFVSCFSAHEARAGRRREAAEDDAQAAGGGDAAARRSAEPSAESEGGARLPLADARAGDNSHTILVFVRSQSISSCDK